jgi:hypothetical protein
MHNSIPKYASTATISTVITIPFHVKSIEKKFLKKWFSPPISSKPLSPQETEQRENRRKGKKKGKTRKKKFQESVQIKGKSKFWEEKNISTSKTLFDVIPFSPPPSYHFKNLFQNHWESFLNSFLAIL